MLPGVGIFGSDPVCKVLIQILKHFDFEINAIWTNFYEFDAKKLIDSTTSNGTSSPSIGSASSSSSSSTTTTGAANKANNYAKLITTSIDSVLLNKNVNLVFVCCQPNLHSQISTKALGDYYNIISTYGNPLNSYTNLFWIYSFVKNYRLYIFRLILLSKNLKATN